MQKIAMVLLFLFLVAVAGPVLFGCEEVPVSLDDDIDDNDNDAHINDNSLAVLLTGAEDALQENRWEEAGEYLEEAAEIPGAVEEPIMIEIKRTAEMNVDVIEALKEERIITEEQIRAGINEFSENQPPAPSAAILDAGSEELYDWFKTLAYWREDLLLLPLDLAEKYDMGWPNWGLFQEEGVNALREVSEKYLLEPGAPFYLRDINLGDTVFYHIIATGLEGINDLFLMENSQLIEAVSMENEVRVTLELKEELMLYGEVFETGEYLIIYEVHFMDDVTFRVGDYRIRESGSG